MNREYAKAIVGGLTAGLTALATALVDDLVSPVELVGIALAVLGTYGAVRTTRNAPGASKPTEEETTT